ncbi:diphthine--ammonia ligase [Dehalogenimonas sp. 4OHTPN]|uniref:Diphthine--ammonia ligase n=1 Tax=Dehalogenimonas sp. 4OHTPN TaxID=3166643 RepID=A0AAU8GCV8_9CHLR
MTQVVTSWSGGKDSCLALAMARESGMKVTHLLNILNEDGRTSCTHGLSSDLMQAQARSMGIPLIQLVTNGFRYEADFKKCLKELHKQGVEGGIFGNGDVERQWIDSVCREVGIAAHLPLEGMTKDRILREFISRGFEAIVVTTRADVMGEEWLGRKLDAAFLRDWDEIRREKKISRAAEAGAYHTTVLGGPAFKKNLEIVESNKVLQDGFWYLNILKVE